jgi:hypothetical protein
VPRMAPPGTMGDEELYLFDLQGWIIVEGALSPAEVARLNAEVDRSDSEGEMKEYPRDLSGGSAALAGTPIAGQPEGRHRRDLGGMLRWESPRSDPFRELLCHPSTKPYLDVILGKEHRLDHGPGLIAMDCGTQGGTLHHGASDIFDLSLAYEFKNGRIMTGLTVVEFLLADEGPGDGGVAIVSGSHKANVPAPRSVKMMEKHQHAVTELNGKAGDAIIFTETCTHGTLPWRAAHQRRALLYKFSPGYLSFGTPSQDVTDPAWMAGMTAEQKQVMLHAHHGDRGLGPRGEADVVARALPPKKAKL